MSTMNTTGHRTLDILVRRRSIKRSTYPFCWGEWNEVVTCIRFLTQRRVKPFRRGVPVFHEFLLQKLIANDQFEDRFEISSSLVGSRRLTQAAVTKNRRTRKEF
jgi:hypothetical protein